MQKRFNTLAEVFFPNSENILQKNIRLWRSDDVFSQQRSFFIIYYCEWWRIRQHHQNPLIFRIPMPCALYILFSYQNHIRSWNLSILFQYIKYRFFIIIHICVRMFWIKKVQSFFKLNFRNIQRYFLIFVQISHSLNNRRGYRFNYLKIIKQKRHGAQSFECLCMLWQSD